jgi:hypothetical protein
VENETARVASAVCIETADRPSDYLEHDLGFRSRRRVARHLRRCLLCRSLLHSLAWTIEQLRSLGSTEVPGASVADEVVQRLRSERATSSP